MFDPQARAEQKTGGFKKKKKFKINNDTCFIYGEG